MLLALNECSLAVCELNCIWVVIWRSGYHIAFDQEVNLRQARLVLRCATVGHIQE